MHYSLVQIECLKDQMLQSGGQYQVRFEDRVVNLSDDLSLVLCEGPILRCVDLSGNLSTAGTNLMTPSDIDDRKEKRSTLTCADTRGERIVKVVHDDILLSEGGGILYRGGGSYRFLPRGDGSFTQLDELPIFSQLACKGWIAVALDGEGNVYYAVPPENRFCLASGWRNIFKAVTQDNTGAALPKISEIKGTQCVGVLLSVEKEVFIFANYPSYGGGSSSFYFPTKVKVPLESGDSVRKIISNKYDLYVLTEKGHVLECKDVSMPSSNNFVRIGVDLGPIQHVVTERFIHSPGFVVLVNQSNESFIKGEYTCPGGLVNKFEKWTSFADAGLENVFEYIRIAKDTAKAGCLSDFKDFLDGVPKRFLPLMEEVYYAMGVKLFEDGEEDEAIDLWTSKLQTDSAYFKKAALAILEALYGQYITVKAEEEPDQECLKELQQKIAEFCGVLCDYSKLLKIEFPQFEVVDKIDSPKKYVLACLLLGIRGMQHDTYVRINLSQTYERFARLVKAQKSTQLSFQSACVLGAGAGCGAGAGSGSALSL